MPFREMQLGQAQPAEAWESGIRRVRRAKGGPAWSATISSPRRLTAGRPPAGNSSRASGVIAGSTLTPTAGRGRSFGFRCTSSTDTLAKRGILRGDITVQWQPAELTPETLAQPDRIDLAGLEWLERTLVRRRSTRPAGRTSLPNDGNIFIDPLILYDFNGDGRVEVILGCKNRIYRNLGEGRFKAETLCPKFSETVFNVTLEDLSGDGVVDVVACGHDGIYLIEGESGWDVQR